MTIYSLFPIYLCICFIGFEFLFHISTNLAFFKIKIGKLRQRYCLLGAYYSLAVKEID